MISKQFGASSIELNAATTLSITITNPNVGTALTGLAFTDPLPAGLIVGTPNGLSSTCNGTVTATAGSSSVALTGGTLASLGSCTIVVNVKGTTLGEKSNTTDPVSSTESGTGESSNTAILTVIPPELVFEDGFEPTN